MKYSNYIILILALHFGSSTVNAQDKPAPADTVERTRPMQIKVKPSRPVKVQKNQVKSVQVRKMEGSYKYDTAKSQKLKLSKPEQLKIVEVRYDSAKSQKLKLTEVRYSENEKSSEKKIKLLELRIKELEKKLEKKKEEEKTKEIVLEADCPQNGTVLLKNTGKATIRTVNSNKVIVKTTVPVSETESSDEESFKNYGIGLKKVGTIVIIKKIDNKKMNGNNLDIYIPEDANLKIDTKYSDISIENNIKNLEVISVGSTISIDVVSDLEINSMDDHYKIEKVETITGKKNFGYLEIALLQKKLDLKGNNTDIKIKNIGADAKIINIENSYADLYLPLKKLETYAVNFEGGYSTVYAPFKIPGPPEKPKAPGAPKPMEMKFTTSVGNTVNSHALVQVKCNFCMVNLN